MSQRKPIVPETRGNLHHNDELYCSTSFCHPSTTRGLFEFHPLSLNSEWLKPNNTWCWHCCHDFETAPVYIPHTMKTISDDETEFAVYGNFCSLACAMAYLMEHQNFDSPNQMYLLQKMASYVYNVHTPISHAPPRVCLVSFGGAMALDDFRGDSQMEQVSCPLPPFVSSNITVHSQNMPPSSKAGNGDAYPNSTGDDRIFTHKAWNVRDIRRPSTECNMGPESQDVSRGTPVEGEQPVELQHTRQTSNQRGTRKKPEGLRRFIQAVDSSPT